MTNQPSNPSPAPGFRPVDLSDCSPKCKCHFGVNKGKAYNLDRPCWAKDGFSASDCTCSGYPVGMIFYQQVPKTRACMKLPDAGCCCGKWGIYEAGGKGTAPNCLDENECENFFVDCEPGCIATVEIKSPGIIVDYGTPYVINKPMPAPCPEAECPPSLPASCGDRVSWNSALGTSVDFIILPSDVFPFYRMVDAKLSGGVDRIDKCCSAPLTVYGDCTSGYTEYPGCGAPYEGVAGNTGFLNCPAVPATVEISGKEYSVLFFYPSLAGNAVNPPLCRPLIAVSLIMELGSNQEGSPEFIYGSQDRVLAINRSDCRTDEECGHTACPDDGSHEICKSKGCVRVSCYAFGGCKEYDHPRYWYPPCNT